MITVLIRTIILYIFVLFSLRLMGKGELSEMQPFELVIMLMIAELAALPMGDVGLPLINGIIAIATLAFIQIVISFINLKSEKARAIICGKPSILVDKGRINEKELKDLRININDLMEQLRTKDCPSLGDVEFAILETNGDLSVIKKSNKMPLTPEDMNMSGKYEGLPVSLIIDGHINYDNLRKAGLHKNWLDSQLRDNGVKDVKEVLFSFVDANQKIFIQKKDKS